MNMAAPGNISVPKIAIDPQWVAHTLIPYLRHAFSHKVGHNHDITPYVERALDFCKTKPDFFTDGDDLIFERIVLAIEQRIKGHAAESIGFTDNLEPLAKYLIRRAQLKGPYELLGRDPRPSAEWMRFESERRANLAAGKPRDMAERANGIGRQLPAGSRLTSTSAQQSQARLTAPQPTSTIRSTASTGAPLSLRQHPRFSPRTSPINHLIDPRLLYALPGQYASPNLPDILTTAEDQHHRRKSLEFQRFLATRPANEPWWQHQHMLIQAAATLYGMARTDSQGYQGTGSALNNGQGQTMGYGGMMSSQQAPPPMVYLNPRQPWTGSANAGQPLAPQTGVAQHRLQAPGQPAHNLPRQDTAYRNIISDQPPAQPLFSLRNQRRVDSDNSLGHSAQSAAPVQHTQQMPAPTATMFTPPQQFQQPLQQRKQPMRLIEPRRTPVPLPVLQAQPEQLVTRRKGRSVGLPTLTQPAGITKATTLIPQTPRTPSCVDPSVWATLNRAEKIQKLLDIDREQKEINPGVKTLLEERMEKDLFREMRREMKRISGTSTQTASGPFGSAQTASSASTVPVRQDGEGMGAAAAMPAPTTIAFRVQGYQNDPVATSAYAAQGDHGGERSAPKMQVFTNHPGFSNILSSFPPPRFHGLPEEEEGEKRVGEMGWGLGVRE